MGFGSLTRNHAFSYLDSLDKKPVAESKPSLVKEPLQKLYGATLTDGPEDSAPVPLTGAPVPLTGTPVSLTDGPKDPAPVIKVRWRTWSLELMPVSSA